jgi:hypothetical protein
VTLLDKAQERDCTRENFVIVPRAAGRDVLHVVKELIT